MGLRRIRLGLAVVVLLATALWSAKHFSPGPFPVEIRSRQIITRPQVAMTMNTALILSPDGTVWGWGRNSGGLLGPINQRGLWNVPRKLEVGSNWVSLAAGLTFALGLKSDGSVWGWTFNPYIGPKSIGLYTNPPSQLAPRTNWVAVTAGLGHALALRTDGSLWSWGQNDCGQVGDGTTNWPATPVPVGENRNWTAVAAGGFGSVGLQSDGSLWHWGFVHAGYSKEPDIKLNEPTRVDDGTNWVATFANEYCYFARQRDGSLWVWGPNAARFGNTNRQLPFRFTADTNSLAAATATSTFLALKQDGTMWSCGDTLDGALGRTSDGNPALLGRIGNRADWVAVWAGPATGFALTQDGTLWTWGEALSERSVFREVMEALETRLRNRFSSVTAARQQPPVMLNHGRWFVSQPTPLCCRADGSSPRVLDKAARFEILRALDWWPR